jgi:ribosomal protein L37E
MGRRKIVNCKRCGKYSPNLSRHKLCPECQSKAIYNAMIQLHQKKGEVFEKWRARMAQAMERLAEEG